MKKGESKTGFTIIEVVLVLAVAGLIFVMVFIALPALQRAQRDNSRRDTLMNIVSQVKRYQQSNRGALPGSSDTLNTTADVVRVEPDEGGNVTGSSTSTKWAGFYKDYLLTSKNFIDPDGSYYNLAVMLCNNSVVEDSACTGYRDWLTGLPDTSFPNDHRIIVVLQAKCKNTEAVGSSNPRNLAVIYRLEGSGAYCFNT